jgi:SAM-dependent methyltransferase
VIDCDEAAEHWVASLIERHTTRWSRPEFLRAVRALSARYVERPHARTSQPTDSPAKRAAFAAFYAPLHFLTVRRIAQALVPADDQQPRHILDLGCGTGAVSAGWTCAVGRPLRVTGVDLSSWALHEARLTWRHFHLHGGAVRSDVESLLTTTAGSRPTSVPDTILMGWCVNELNDESRNALLPLLHTCASRGAAILVVEPIARRITPWWRLWSDVFLRLGGRADDWKFEARLRGRLADID